MMLSISGSFLRLSISSAATASSAAVAAATMALPARGGGLLSSAAASFHTSSGLSRARRATRLRKRKITLANKKKKEERLKKNPLPVPQSVLQRLKAEGVFYPPLPFRPDESELEMCKDNVYLIWKFCYPRYELSDALTELRRHYHSSMLNRPDDVVYAKVEIDMNSTKKDKYLDEFQKMVPVVHPFGRNVALKNVCAFVPNEEEEAKAKEAGAALVGGTELITEIIKGRVDIIEMDHFICHEDLLVHMRSVAGMLRDKTPKKLDGTVGQDIQKMIRTFRSGMTVQVKKVVPSVYVAKQPDYGYCEASLGYLSTEDEKLKDNLDVLLETLMEAKPRREKGGFITRVQLQLMDGSPHAIFAIKHPLIYDEKLQEQVVKPSKEEAEIA